MAKLEGVNQSAELDQFLASLQLEAEIGKAPPAELPRVAQLIQKTNQFNLTTRRYSLGEIETLASSPNHLLLVMKVRDKYGEYGLTGVAIVNCQADTCHIDTFLMSCRILGRKLEDVFLNQLRQQVAEKWGTVTTLTAEYLPTAKNGQVADFFDKNGFRCRCADQPRRWYESVLSAEMKSIDYIKVIRR